MKLFPAAVLFLIARALAAEPLVMDLWPGRPPGDAGISGEESSRIHASKIVGPTKLITNVTRPTLTVYRPLQRNIGTAMVICPGGGYTNLYWELEGEEVAAWLNSLGVTGIILKYRVPRRLGEVRGEPPAGPLLDAQRAISTVRHRAREWALDPNRIGIIGFSAGGHLALATATSFETRTYARIDVVDDVSNRPDFAILCYAGLLKAKERDEIAPWIRIPANTPPVFLAHASDDTSAIGGSNPTTAPSCTLRYSGRKCRWNCMFSPMQPRLRCAHQHEARGELDGALREVARQLRAAWGAAVNAVR